jgi:hypothetical protein
MARMPRVDWRCCIVSEAQLLDASATIVAQLNGIATWSYSNALNLLTIARWNISEHSRKKSFEAPAVVVKIRFKRMLRSV